MEANINLYSVTKELSNIVKEHFFVEENASPSLAEIEIAKMLYQHLGTITCDYIFIEENENDYGNDSKEIDYIDDDGVVIKRDIPLETKMKILKAKEDHPNWSFGTLKTRHPQLIGSKDLSRWRKHIDSGGTYYDKLVAVNKYAIEMFTKARKTFKSVHDIDIRKWALQESSKFNDFRFKASPTWVRNFKVRNGISSRKIQKIVSKRELQDMEELLQDAQKFRQKFNDMSPQYSPQTIWNTDQTGFNYEILPNRTLSWKGEKATFGFGVSPKNCATHSYTVQPIISLEGKIVGDFLVCLQEPNGKLGPKVEESIFLAPNLTVTVSSSGKLTSSHVSYFLDKVVIPETLKNPDKPYLLTFDHWSGQIDPDLYERFGKKGISVLDTLLVPEKCTATCQPMDTYFNRQLKDLAKRILSHAQLHECEHVECRLTDRDSILKLQSLLHFTLSAPVFEPMIRHCWYTSGLLEQKEEFQNIKQACFSFNERICQIDNCMNNSFIKCSRCFNVICFDHFYHDYHLYECPQSPWLKQETYAAAAVRIVSASEEDSTDDQFADEESINQKQLPKRRRGRSRKRGRGRVRGRGRGRTGNRGRGRRGR